MTTTKLRLDLNQGLLEVEGSDDFVREIYTDFKEQLHRSGKAKTPHNSQSASPPPSEQAQQSSPPPSPKSSSKKRSSSNGSQPTIVKDLDLSGASKGVERLKDFHASYKITSNLERNLVFLYYLQNMLEISPITPNHVFTCYRDVSVKVPAALVQSLRDTANRRGWIDTSDTNNLKVTFPGINHLEHDLEKAKPSA